MESLKGLYHADKLDEQSFIDNFTIRLKEYRLIYENLLQQKQKPLQHFLITGKRGMGKSTLLRRIYIEATKPPLSDKLFAVRLGSEQYKLSRLFKLWEQVIDHLAQVAPELKLQKKELESSKEYENNLVHIITDYLAQEQKTLLLLIDNFDQFIEKLTNKEQHALREILIQFPLQIIGNTVFYNEHFKSYNKPFYDFFKPIKLSNLDREEAEEFIKLRAATEGIENFDELYTKQYGKIQALRILSGGVPRTLLILLSIIAKKNTGDAVDYLHEMIEQTTPLYQDRMKALSSQQQEIMHHLAMHWDRTGVKELAAEIRIPSKSISAQLIQLEAMGYINKVETTNRNFFYEIDERFFNIWLLMSEAPPHDSKRVIWLTKWLDAFYSNDELKDFASFCHSNLKSAKPANRLLIAQALSESEKLDYKLKRQIVSETTEDLKGIIPETMQWELTFNYKVNEHAKKLDKEVRDLINAASYDKALEKLNALEEIDEEKGYLVKGILFHLKQEFKEAEKYYLMAIAKGNDKAMVNLGYLYETGKKDIATAEKYYLMAVEKGNDIAMLNLGYLYKTEKNDITTAEKYYLMAVAKGNDKAMVNLGYLYKTEKNDIATAEKYYLMAVEKGNSRAMRNLGYLYKTEKQDIATAEKYYLMAVEKGNDKAMVNLGYLYETEKNDIATAEKYYLMAVEKGNDRAMANLGYLYATIKKDIAKAEKYHLMAVEKGNGKAMVNLGYLYETEKQDFAAAEKYYLMAVEKGNDVAMVNLGYFYVTIKKDVATAEKYYLMAIEKGNSNAMVNLGYLYETEKKDIATAEKYYLMAVGKDNILAMYNLGVLYEEKKDFVTAEKYYLKGSDAGDVDSIFGLILMYIEQNKIDKKETALNICEKLIKSHNKYFFEAKAIYINLLLWNERMKEAFKAMQELLLLQEYSGEELEVITETLLNFIVFRQKQLLYKIFQSNEDYMHRFKPVYYTLMYEMQEEFPKEYLKMTDELKEPVNAMLESVKKERERLGLI